MLKRLFWNPEELRVVTLWRLLLQTLVMPLSQAPLLLGMLLLGLAGLQVDLAPLLRLNEKTNVLVTVTFLTTVWLAGRFLDRRKFADFGLHLSPNWWKDLGFGLLLGAGLMALIFVVELAAGWITVTGTQQSANGPSSFWTDWLWMLALFINVGFYEELLSRGYHIKNLSEGLNFKWLNPKLAILLSMLLASLVFSLMHAGNPNATWVSAFNLFLSGILLAAGFILTGELAIPIGTHIAWNFFQGNVFGFPVSGINAGATLLAIEQGGPALVTGGAFGPEAGLVGIAAMVLGCVLIMGYVKWRYGTAGVLTRLAVPDFLPKHQAKLARPADVVAQAGAAEPSLN